MKIIFLDIDGVLNSIGWVERTKGTAYEDKEIDPSKVRLLKQIIDKTDAKIVLSSTWREVDGSDDIPRHQMYDYLVEELGTYRIEIFSRTPLINNNRPKEIKRWLEETPFKVDKFISLDDDFDKKDYQKYGISDCLIKTEYWNINGGLSKEYVEKAIKKLL